LFREQSENNMAELAVVEKAAAPAALTAEAAVVVAVPPPSPAAFAFALGAAHQAEFAASAEIMFEVVSHQVLQVGFRYI
jgi:hypothetical protein